jgi:hypothetical protein
VVTEISILETIEQMTRTVTLEETVKSSSDESLPPIKRGNCVAPSSADLILTRARCCRRSLNGWLDPAGPLEKEGKS